MKCLFFCLGIAAGLAPVANGQNFPTNSNFRIEMGPGQINPLVGGSYPTSWYIEDYIERLTASDDITILNPSGNRFFNYRTTTAGSINTYYYGKFFFDGLSDINVDSGIVMSSGRVVYCGGVSGVDPGMWPGIPHAAQYHSSGPQSTHAMNCFAEHPV